MQEYPGKQCHVRDQPNVLVVAHFVGEHLFGSERSFLDMLDGLAHLPANIYVALPRDVAAYTSAVRDKAEHVFVFEYGWWQKGKAASEVVRETFKKIIAGNAIDVVHSNTIMLRESLEAAKECEVQSVIHVREIITQDDQLMDLIGQPAAEIKRNPCARRLDRRQLSNRRRHFP